MNKQSQASTPGSRRPTRVPAAINLIRYGVRVLDVLSPQLSGRWVYRLWFRTHRSEESGREERWLKQADKEFLPCDGGPLAVYRWGSGAQTVVLLHGWCGRGTQLGAFAAPLVEAGYRVIAFDAPGHGRTPGSSSSIFHFIDALKHIEQKMGPFDTVITHSFGGMAIARALNGGLTADKVVCICPPTRMEFLLESFSQMLKLPPRTREVLTQLLEHKYGKDIWSELSAAGNAEKLSIPALIVHDEDDRDVPWQQGKLLADAWPGARWMLTRGLGHRRILRDQNTIKAIVQFVVG